MPISAIPDILSHARLSRNVADIKQRTDTTRTEAVTGRRDDLTEASDGDVGGLHMLRKAANDAAAYVENLSLSEARLKRTQIALSTISGFGDRIATETFAAVGRNDDIALRTSATDAEGAIQTIFAALNTTDGDRALFSGDLSDRAPLALADQFLAEITAIVAGAVDETDVANQLDFYFNDPAGGFQTSIYQGGANPGPSIEIGPGIRVSATVEADAQPIKDLLRGLAEIATHQSASFANKAAVAAAGASNAATAETALTDLRAGLGVKENQVTAARERHEAEELVLTALYNSKVSRDPYEAASQLRLLESHLEATYIMTSRLANLSFANYLR